MRSRVGQAGLAALTALSLQLLVGASAVPCTSIDHSADYGDGGPQSAGMAGMSMPDGGATEHSRDDCNEQQTTQSCPTGSACAVMAIPAAGVLLASAEGPPALPSLPAAALRSSLIAPDRPPPRA